MTREARLEDVGTGLAPVDDGWFVVNAGDAAWIENPAFGFRCPFEASPPVLRGRDDVEPRHFPQIGINLAILQPGRPSGLYHRENEQEDFLVLRGECLLLIEGEERMLRAWDFVHCPAWTDHVFVGAGDGPCAILMIGGRPEEEQLLYPVSEVAAKHGASATEETQSGDEAYADWPGEYVPVRLPWPVE